MLLSVMRAVLTALAVLAGTPAFAQVDLTGFWAARGHEDLEGMLPGDYAGLPINDEARARADAFMLSYLARVARDRRCALMEWSSLAWNDAAKQFYLHLGAEAEERWMYRLSGTSLQSLANKKG